MPQLIVLTVIGAGAVAGYRWLSRQMRATALADEQSRRATEQATLRPKDLGQLEWDAENGVYRPRDRLV